MFHVCQVGHIKRLQHGIRDIQCGKLPRRLLPPTCGVMSENLDVGCPIIPPTPATSTTSRMSQSSTYSSSFHATRLNVPHCELPHIQISDSDIGDPDLVIETEEELFNQARHIHSRRT